MKIPFNRTYLSGLEIKYISKCLNSRKTSGDSYFTKKCQTFFSKRYNFESCMLTSSCTDALEMTSVLLDIGPGDEVIVPSFTFVSTANAYALRGASIKFIDSLEDSPNINPNLIEKEITNKTKAIVPIHYAGIACEIYKILDIANHYGIAVVEDAAQAIDSFYKQKPLGSFGDFSTFSFHETKNISSGEGGMLVTNNKRFSKRAEIVREKGTNRSAFFRGEVDKYNWVDIGSSYLASDITAAYLLGQLENISSIQKRRIDIWNKYFNGLKDLEDLGYILLPKITKESIHNAHMFYIVCRSLEIRSKLQEWLKNIGIQSSFHYQSLHRSPFIKSSQNLPNSDKFSNCLLRLPLYYELKDSEIELILNSILDFYVKK